ncbi:Radial spoke head protein 4 A [Homalodisca vitripennis]|nr:Radial spoke head protein 4 A [Homalodisca vitripennis]
MSFTKKSSQEFNVSHVDSNVRGSLKSSGSLGRGISKDKMGATFDSEILEHKYFSERPLRWSKSKISSRATTTALADEQSLQRRKKLLPEDSYDTDHVKSEESSQSKGSGENPALPNVMSAVDSINKGVPSVKYDVRKTKLFLQQQGVGNLSIWHHLTNVLNKIIAEQPANVIDYFEEYSRKVKEEQLTELDLLRDIYVPSPHLESAKNQLSLINVSITSQLILLVLLRDIYVPSPHLESAKNQLSLINVSITSQLRELDLMRDIYVPSPHLESAKNQLSLINVSITSQLRELDLLRDIYVPSPPDPFYTMPAP